MIVRQARKSLLVRFILLVLVGILILYVGMGFLDKASVSRQQRKELDRIEKEKEAAMAETLLLEEEWERTKSPEAAEEWARENGLTRSGEVSVIVVAPSADPSVEGLQGQENETSSDSNRNAWWKLFFGGD
jgi:cell division protein FtsB